MSGIVLIGWLATATAGFAAGTLELVSQVYPRRLSDTAAGAGAHTIYPASPAISADGRYVAFLSAATNLVPGQKESASFQGTSRKDAFLHDRVTGETLLLSHSAASPSTTSNRGANGVAISADGRFVAFLSASTDILAGQTSTLSIAQSLFLYDRVKGTTTLVSSSSFLHTNGGFGVREMAISADGRFIAFSSDAPDVVPGQQDTNFIEDVFLYDRVAATTSLVSHVPGSAATAGNEQSLSPSISADGRFVVFGSGATDLAPGDTSSGNVELYDRLSGAVVRVGPGGHSAISADGGTLLFFSADPNVVPGQIDDGTRVDAFLYDRATRKTTLVSHAAGLPTTAADGESSSVAQFLPSLGPSLSADGRFALFHSTAKNLVPGQSVPDLGSVFLYDRTSGTVTLVGPLATAASISADGRFVAFPSDANNLVPGQSGSSIFATNVFLYDRSSGATALVSGANGSPFLTADDQSLSPVLSADGSQVVYYSDASNLVAGVKDANRGQDVVLYDTRARANAYVTLHAPGEPSLSPDADSTVRGISADGRYILFESTGINLVAGQIDGNRVADVFLYDHTTRSSVLVSRSALGPAVAGDNASSESAVSADGRYVAFTSLAGDLVAGVSDPVDPETGQPAVKADVFLFDRDTKSTILLSRSATHPGLTGDLPSGGPAISADGRWVAFTSSATDLIPGLDTSGRHNSNLFLYDRAGGTILLVSRSSGGGPLKRANGNSLRPVLSADGRYVAYLSEASDLVPGQIDDPNFPTPDLFLFDRVTGTTALVSHTRGSAVTAAGVASDPPSLSADGRYLVFASGRADLTDVPSTGENVYLYDRQTGALTLLSPSNDYALSGRPIISTDGRWVAFLSTAGDLVPGGQNIYSYAEIYLYDRLSGSLKLVTSSVSGLANPLSQGGVTNFEISADGRFVAFTSNAPDLVPGQSPDDWGARLYLYDRLSGAPALIGHVFNLQIDPGDVLRLSASGQQVAFTSFDSTLVPGDFNTRSDVFLYTVSSGPVTLPPCNLFSGSLRSSSRKTLAVAGACGVPSGAKQATVKLTVSQGTGKGNVQLYPGNVTSPSSGILRFNRGATRSAGFTVSLGNGGIALLPFVAGNGTVRVTVEVDGYTP